MAASAVLWPSFETRPAGAPQDEDLLHLPAKQPFGVAVRDALGLLRRQLRQPAAVFLEDAVIGEPALVDPGVGAEQETVGIACEQVAPFGRKLSPAFRDAAAIGKLADQRRIAVEQLAHPRGRDRKSGMCPDDPRLGVVAEQGQQRFLVAMRVQPEIALDREVDDLLHPRSGGPPPVDAALAAAALLATPVQGLEQVKD